MGRHYLGGDTLEDLTHAHSRYWHDNLLIASLPFQSLQSQHHTLQLGQPTHFTDGRWTRNCLSHGSVITEDEGSCCRCTTGRSCFYFRPIPPFPSLSPPVQRFEAPLSGPRPKHGGLDPTKSVVFPSEGTQVYQYTVHTCCYPKKVYSKVYNKVNLIYRVYSKV